MDFQGPSKHYLRQQTQIAVAVLDSLQELDGDSERQGLAALVAHCQNRLAQLAVRAEEVVVPVEVKP